MKRMIFVAVLGVLSGCATTTDVVPMGKDTYSVGTQVRGGMTSWTEVKQKSIERANAYCAAKGTMAEVHDGRSNRDADAWGAQLDAARIGLDVPLRF